MKAPPAAAAVSFVRALQRLSQLNTSGGRGGGRPRPGPGERAGEKVKLFPGSFLPAPPVDPPGEWLSSAYLPTPSPSPPVWLLRHVRSSIWSLLKGVRVDFTEATTELVAKITQLIAKMTV